MNISGFRHRGLCRLVFATLFNLVSAAGWAATEQHCADGTIVVESAAQGAVADICSAGAAAIRFLAEVGLQPKRSIRIRVVQHPLDQLGHPIFGRYDSRSDQVDIMSLAAIFAQVEQAEMYGQVFAAEHYRGVVAHEVAHAVVQHNRRVDPVSGTAQEYLAHATQLAVLSPERRGAIIAAADVGAWEPNDVISDIYMAMSLTRFAVKSYLHLSQSDDPASFVQILISAKWRYVHVQ